MVQSQKQIYEDMKLNFTSDVVVRGVNKVVVPSQNSIEAFRGMRKEVCRNQNRRNTLHSYTRPKDIKTSDKEISVYNNSNFSKNDNVMSAMSSGTNMNNDI